MVSVGMTTRLVLLRVVGLSARALGLLGCRVTLAFL